jgi:hypothetical protein
MAKAGVSVGAWTRDGHRCAAKGETELVQVSSTGTKVIGAGSGLRVCGARVQKLNGGFRANFTPPRRSARSPTGMRRRAILSLPADTGATGKDRSASHAGLERTKPQLLRLVTAGKTLERIQGRPECFSQAIAHGLHS